MHVKPGHCTLWELPGENYSPSLHSNKRAICEKLPYVGKCPIFLQKEEQ